MDIERLKQTHDEYLQNADAYVKQAEENRELALQNYGAAEAIRRLIEQLESEEVNDTKD